MATSHLRGDCPILGPWTGAVVLRDGDSGLFKSVDGVCKRGQKRKRKQAREFAALKCWPVVTPLAVGFLRGRVMEKRRDYLTSERSHTGISCHTRTTENGRANHKLYFLRLGPRSQMACARYTSSSAGCLQGSHATSSKTGPSC